MCRFSAFSSAAHGVGQRALLGHFHAANQVAAARAEAAEHQLPLDLCLMRIAGEQDLRRALRSSAGEGSAQQRRQRPFRAASAEKAAVQGRINPFAVAERAVKRTRETRYPAGWLSS